ncbi:MAG TPA: response regulator [Kofleriaceae bacterium]|jgi:DNA-binding response OmpR family regulator
MTEILVVDGNGDGRAALTEALAVEGFRPFPCAGLAEARAALRAHPIALVVLEVHLPDGDGIDLLQQIRRDRALANLPVLVQSAEAPVAERVKHLRGGANDFIGRTDPQTIVARVRELLRAPAPDVVLVIDPDDAMRVSLATALARAGLAAAPAATGAEGLRLAARVRPTAIVLEATLPDMDAASVVRRIRLDPALRVTPCLQLALSPDREAEVRALDAGADGVVRKADVELVVARVKALLRAAQPRPAAVPLLAPKRVLACDDDPEYRGLLADRLRKRGYDVAHAACGEDAIDLLGAQRVDCILLDRSMAGLGGVETCRRLKATPGVQETPLIVVTATETREAALEAFAAGADDFVSKGAGFEVLSARISAQIRRRQIEDEQRNVREQILRADLELANLRAHCEQAELRAAHADATDQRNRELAAANRELEAFAYRVSHDLRAALRTIGAFTEALGLAIGEQADERARNYLSRVIGASKRMGTLIDGLVPRRTEYDGIAKLR